MLTGTAPARLKLRQNSTTNNTNLTNEDGRLDYRVIVRIYDHDEFVGRYPRVRSSIRKIRVIRG